MLITYDINKSQRNIKLRDLSFEKTKEFDWDTALIWQDERFQYLEIRFIALGYLDERLHSICFTPRDDSIRIISFRKANKREQRKYEREYK
ncbi:BrnT family toxin [Pasteurella bettyae]|uniref:BrnT family toxin n=1 Tax=Pasteurella bettyae TaxID=752 RepID=UPI00058CC422|nr:BrnT family toxin [Pasteurella bettyae]SUB21920.1 Protein of uncharacterised function (DUF497) [Pasteurella bettyae]